MGNFLKYYADTKKPDTKENLLHDPHLHEVQDRQIHLDRNQNSGFGRHGMGKLFH